MIVNNLQLTDTTVEPGGDLDLAVEIVTAGPAAAALLGSTDDGCDTQKNGDC